MRIIFCHVSVMINLITNKNLQGGNKGYPNHLNHYFSLIYLNFGT